MIIKLISTAVMGIAALFGLEALGIVPQGKYFPTMPRLDQAANTPGNWLQAGNWGMGVVSCLTQGEPLGVCTDNGLSAQPAAGVTTEGASAANDRPTTSSFTERVSHKADALTSL